MALFSRDSAAGDVVVLILKSSRCQCDLCQSKEIVGGSQQIKKKSLTELCKPDMAVCFSETCLDLPF